VVAAVVFFNALPTLGTLSQAQGSVLLERLEELSLLDLGGILVDLRARAALVPLGAMRCCACASAMVARHDRVLVRSRVQLPSSAPRPRAPAEVFRTLLQMSAEQQGVKGLKDSRVS
jgi:hypothetical protein